MNATPLFARAEALFRRVGDEVLLARPEGSAVDRLSVPASALWLQLERPRTRADLIRALAAEFGIDADDLAGHADRLIRELESSGWIVTANADD